MSNLEHKTVRPGSLNNYAYYYSNRRPPAQTAAKLKPVHAPLPLGRLFKGLLVLVLIGGALIGLPMLRSNADKTVSDSSTTSPTQSLNNQPAVNAATTPKLGSTNYCAGNTESKFIKVSVEKRHMWACENGKTVHDNPVITGLRSLPENITPLGTYRIYGKTTDTRLSGTDSRGSWDYPVSYWMPFLDNEHGTYGFHDATWRSNNEFGNVSPDDKDKASRGCVELPLVDQKWLYDWAPVGTLVTVEN